MKLNVNIFNENDWYVMLQALDRLADREHHIVRWIIQPPLHVSMDYSTEWSLFQPKTIEVDLRALEERIVTCLQYMKHESVMGKMRFSIQQEIDEDDSAFISEILERLNSTIKEKKMEKPSILLSRLLDSNTKTLIKAGYIDSGLELTEKGKDVMLALLLETSKAKLVVEAKKELEENKDEK